MSDNCVKLIIYVDMVRNARARTRTHLHTHTHTHTRTLELERTWWDGSLTADSLTLYVNYVLQLKVKLIIS